MKQSQSYSIQACILMVGGACANQPITAVALSGLAILTWIAVFGAKKAEELQAQFDLEDRRRK